MQHKKHLVTASYVDDSMSRLDEKAKSVGITILCEMGLDPGIGTFTTQIFALYSLFLRQYVMLKMKRRFKMLLCIYALFWD